MENYSKPIDRKFLVSSLEELLSDEYEPSKVAYMTDNEIIRRIIDAALWYKEKTNN